MRYVSVNNNFGVENLTLESGPEPKPNDGETLVRMKASALNYVDLAVVNGKLGADIPLPFIPVADGAGIVEKVGGNVQGFKAGDKVSTLYIPPWSGGRYRREHTGMAIRPAAARFRGNLPSTRCSGHTR